MIANNENKEPHFYTPAEVAEFLRVHPRTVTGWLQTGKLRGNQLANERWVIPADAVRDLLEAGSNTPAVVSLAPIVEVPPSPAAPVVQLRREVKLESFDEDFVSSTSSLSDMLMSRPMTRSERRRAGRR